MRLDDYLSKPGSLTPRQLADAIGVKDTSQIRAWRYAYGDNRKPGPPYCAAIEVATGKQVRRWDLRPLDWHRIWPELVGQRGAPKLPKVSA